MIEINGKIYRNLQEQVKKNMEDIEEIKESTVDAYSKAEADEKFSTKVYVNTTFTTRPQVEEIITTKTSNFLDKSKRYDDPDNPREVYFRYPFNISDPFVIIDSQDDTHHPDSSGIIMRPTSISIEASSSNHGDLDIDYVGGIEVNDGGARAYTNDDDGNKVYFPLTQHRVQHDIIFYIADSNNNEGVMHIIFLDNHDTPYTISDISSILRDYVYPELYYRVCNNQTFDNVRGDRIYVYFYTENNELWFEEQDDFYAGGGTYTEESANSYKVIACNDKISKF